MNRFKQDNSSAKNLFNKILPALSFILVLIVFMYGMNSVNLNTLEKRQESLETAIRRAMAQCYAVEGAYPASLQYLQEHYGISYDTDTFFVDYDYYGGNLIPEVTVIRKTRKGSS